jgi:hypothetical protein
MPINANQDQLRTDLWDVFDAWSPGKELKQNIMSWLAFDDGSSL